jgi:hypothetical protein
VGLGRFKPLIVVATSDAASKGQLTQGLLLRREALAERIGVARSYGCESSRWRLRYRGRGGVRLLRDVCGTLLESGVGFVVVGGWVTKLFHAARFGHPGTFDVDVLLEDHALADASFERASGRMLQSGYVRAVKNRFQAHRVMRVAGEDLIFHADFLNTQQPIDDIDLVVGEGRLRSIYKPAMALVFSQVFRWVEPAHGLGLTGVRFPSADTFIATKAQAALVKKRQRDAFDIFVTLRDEGPLEVGRTSSLRA